MTIISFFRAHKRVITFSFVALCAFWLTPSWSEAGPFYFVLAFVLFVMLIAGQLFWVGRVIGLGERFILGKPQRIWLKVIVGVPYLFFFASNFGPWYIPRGDSTHLTLRSVLLDGAWSVWLVGSWVGFALVMVFWTVDRAGRAAAWVYRKAREAAAGPAAASMPGGIPLDPASPARRRLREQAFVRPTVFSAALATMSSILKPRIPSHDFLPRRGFASCVKSGHPFNHTAKC